MKKNQIGFQEALEQTVAHIQPLPPVSMPLYDCEGFYAAEALGSTVDSPSANTSLKDGYAICCEDISEVKEDNPVTLKVCGTVAAGQDKTGAVKRGEALRILTGARLPAGADTIVAEEFACLSGGSITITQDTPKGKNILAKGSDTAVGESLLQPGQRLTPGRIGLLAAGGHARVRVFPKPQVALIATGDEVLLPGTPLTRGKLYASNLLTLSSWCRRFGFKTELSVVGDNADELGLQIERCVHRHDVLVTSGGAWTGDKDLIARVLDQLGWEKKYHRLRLGPGKAAGFGLLKHKPVFILPGGPPSNLIAFLELALPGLMKLAGHNTPGLIKVPARLAQKVTGQSNWTQAIFGALVKEEMEISFHPDQRPASRLKSMAEAQAVLLIPEGVSEIDADETVQVQALGSP